MAVRKKITYTVSSAKKPPARSEKGGGASAGDADAHIRSAEAFYRKNRLEEAVAAYDHAIALTPENAEFHHRRAIALRALNRFDEAIAAYDRAISINPGHVYARNRRGSCLMLVSRCAEGWRDYENRWETGRCIQKKKVSAK